LTRIWRSQTSAVVSSAPRVDADARSVNQYVDQAIGGNDRFRNTPDLSVTGHVELSSSAVPPASSMIALVCVAPSVFISMTIT
jgi:hypothetical protein